MPHSDTPAPNPDKVAKAFTDLARTVHRLRAPGGCPWDIKQTHASLRPYLIEEAYEAVECIDALADAAATERSEGVQNFQNFQNFKEELGDVLLQVVLHAQLAQESGNFDVADIAQSLDEKLVRRHPHVFGSESVQDSDEVLKNWEKRKADEKKAQTPDGSSPASVLSGLPRALPALQRTARMIEKVTKVGFQWPDLQGPMQKVEEEWNELKAEIKPTIDEKSRSRIESELGDVLFSLCNVAHLLKINPEDALRGTLARFESRFRYVETGLHARGKRPEESTLEEMDQLWNEAKKTLHTS